MTELEMVSTAWLRSVVTALAVQRYQRTHQRYPPSLEVLVPDLLPELLSDPVNDQPLRYQARTNGFAVYSVGLNGMDDGGRFLNLRWGHLSKNPDADIGVEIRAH